MKFKYVIKFTLFSAGSDLALKQRVDYLNLALGHLSDYLEKNTTVFVEVLHYLAVALGAWSVEHYIFSKCTGRLLIWFVRFLLHIQDVFPKLVHLQSSCTSPVPQVLSFPIQGYGERETQLSNSKKA